ncbi:hypothetical protein BDV93DRAFT_322999 [Ceratobasidium sp. AG-I]|nr:hypothetical protein BDV93DRAFT_322999 [Ceratobasidium sp. AG-I]
MESELLPRGRGEPRLTNHRPEIAFANLPSLLFYTGPYLKSSVIRDVHDSWPGLFLFRGLALVAFISSSSPFFVLILAPDIYCITSFVCRAF